MNLDKYKHRINYTGILAPTLEVLHKLQKAHLLYVPFENLNIHYNKAIILDVDKIYNKIIHNNRGGICYELNGVFYHFLTKIGFKAKMISGKVFDHKKKKFGPEFDHMAIIVNIHQKEYLVDVGFGEFLFHPLKFELGNVQQDPRGKFIIDSFDENYFQVSKIEQGEKSIEYIFTTNERKLNDFGDMCHYHQTSEQSHFTHKKFIGKPTENGRVTLIGNKLKHIENGDIILETEIADEAFSQTLHKWFNIEEKHN